MSLLMKSFAIHMYMVLFQLYQPCESSMHKLFCFCCLISLFSFCLKGYGQCKDFPTHFCKKVSVCAGLQSV